MLTIDRGDIVNAARDAGLDESAIKADYSGRGMMGQECFGITCDASQLLTFVAYYVRNYCEGDEIPGWLAQVQSDNMGYDTIWYFPGVVLGA
jgi:hypothetical protein